jgi:hypothetical protein
MRDPSPGLHLVDPQPQPTPEPPPPPLATSWLATTEAALRLRCSPSFLRKLCLQGELPHRRLSPRAIRITACVGEESRRA